MQSIRNKCAEVMEHVLDNDTTVIFLSETWMESDKNDITALVRTYGYTLLHNRRKGREKEIGGGVGVLLKSTMIHKHMKCKFFSSFEVTMVNVKITNNTRIILVTIYRVLFIPAATFIKDFTELLEILSVMPEDFILAGDINFHLESNDYYVEQLLKLWTTFNLVQHVHVPTHKLGHTLDLLLTREGSSKISNVLTEDVHLSDHFKISFDFDIEVVQCTDKTITFRDTKSLDCEKFSSELMEKLGYRMQGNFGERVDIYNNTVREMVESYAPLQKKNIKVVPNSPWFDSEYKDLRKLRRRAEKKYKRTKDPIDKENFLKLRKTTTVMAFNKKREHCTRKIEECQSTKALFGCVKELVDSKKQPVLPTHDSKFELATNFNHYFKNKICDIRKAFPLQQNEKSPHVSQYTGTLLETFEVVTEEELRTIVKQHEIKCSPDDPIPAKLLKNMVDVFIPIWLELINLSLSEGSMDSLRCGVLAPLIKSLDSATDYDDYKNYRPVTNLVILSKLIERVVASRIDQHMDVNNLHSHNNYAYKKDHSTELLLTKVSNDLFLACDKKTPTLTMFLDLSAAFDTVDQDRLIQILRDDIGIRGVALKWFDSYLRKRTQKVKIGDEYSDELELDYGVTQGSILGPKLFNIYTKPFPEELKVVSVSVEGYADDNQLMKQFNVIFQVEALGLCIEETFKVIERWMFDNYLKLNSGKTQIMVVAPEGILEYIIINGTFISGKCIRFVEHAKNLGAYIDSRMSMDVQVQKVVSSCFSTIRQLARIKCFLTTEQLQLMACSLILGVMDYCNVLYYGMSAENYNKLQRVQNSAARLACKISCRDKVNSEDLLHKLHWLKVRDRVIYKVLVIVHKCVYGNAPVNLRKLVRFSQSQRLKTLEVKEHYSSFGERAFSVCGPRLWNALPTKLRLEVDVDGFKSGLKTYLFKNGQTFNDLVHMK